MTIARPRIETQTPGTPKPWLTRRVRYFVCPAVAGAALTIIGSAIAGPGPTAGDSVIEAARRAAAAYVQALPDYVVKRTTTRSDGTRPAWSDTAASVKMWNTIDTIAGDVTVQQRNETYENITVNGFRATGLPEKGVWTEGEYSSELMMILGPAAATTFSGQRSITLRKRKAYRYGFAVDQAHSTWRLDAGRIGNAAPGEIYSPAFDGEIWIDADTGQVLRTKMTTRGIPKSFPLEWVQWTTDYDFVNIGGAKYLLPVHSDSYACPTEAIMGWFRCYWNENVFQVPDSSARTPA